MTSVLTQLSLPALTVLAEDAPPNTGPDFGKASPFGLLIVVVLLIATFFLVRSMNRQLKKLPESFDDLDAADDSAGADIDVAEPPTDDRPRPEPGG